MASDVKDQKSRRSVDASFKLQNLYLFLDIFRRKVVGWQVYETEISELASEVMQDIRLRERIAPGQAVLHSDNASPMKGAAMLATLQALGVMPSLSPRR